MFTRQNIDLEGNFKQTLISSLLHLVGMRLRVYYTLTNFRGGGGGNTSMNYYNFHKKNVNLKNNLTHKNDQNIHQDSPDWTILQFFLEGSMPRTPKQSTWGDNYKSKKNGAPPLPNPGYVPLACSKSN